MQDKFDEIMKNGGAENFIKNNLTSAQTQKLNEILNDREKLNRLLSSPTAQELMKKFKDK